MPTITRAQAEVKLIRRIGALLTAAGLDGATVSGSNPDLDDPFGYALRMLSLAVADVSAVTDADLAAITASTLDQFLDLAEYRALLSAQANYVKVDLTIGATSQRFSTLGDRLKDMIATRREAIEATYGIGGAALTSGVLDLDFLANGDDEVVTT